MSARTWGRVLVGTVVLAVMAMGPGTAPAVAGAPASVDGVACSQAQALGLFRQMNFRATEILAGCGLLGPREAVSPSRGGAGRLDPPVNVLVSNGDATFPHVTRSESMVWSSDGLRVVVNFNDSRDAPNNFSGISSSPDGGATFTQIIPSPLATGHGRNIGDPVVVFNARLTTWFAGDLVQGCGSEGIGLWTSSDGVTWAAGTCAHVGSGDDRESMWVDNNSGSPFFGRMYVSWNDFSFGGGQRLFVTFSDDGSTWSAPQALSVVFERDVQLTGAPDSGTVFIAAMDEGGGGFNNRQNIMYRSVDGGVTWDRTLMGGPFAPAGDSTCPSNPYFLRISPIWRFMSWGQPGVGPNGVVHYAFAGAGVNPGDTGDIFYTQSTDNGTTWSAPIVLNSDAGLGGTAAQWMPSLSVSTTGKVQVGWYDRRDSTDGQNYEYFGVQSLDNGQTFQPDTAISDQLIPQPEQPDPNVQSCYAGDYNYHTAFGSTSFATWTDGRLQNAGHNVQNVFFAAVP